MLPAVSKMSLAELKVLQTKRCPAWYWGEHGDEGTFQNDLQRLIISVTQREHGQAYLGEINRDKSRRNGSPIWKWDGGLVHNFCASFVIPNFDAELERLLLDREAATYTGTAADGHRVVAIVNRIYAIGGEHLFWS